MRWKMALVSFAFGVGCGSLHGPNGQGGQTGSYSGAPGTPAGLGAGKIFIDWTVAGQPPSKAACAGVDHLDLRLSSAWGDVTISPIPCTLTRFRYDGLPDGPGTLSLDAHDASGCPVSSGSVDLTVGDTVPDAPSPTVSIGAPQPCH